MFPGLQTLALPPLASQVVLRFDLFHLSKVFQHCARTEVLLFGQGQQTKTQALLGHQNYFPSSLMLCGESVGQSPGISWLFQVETTESPCGKRVLIQSGSAYLLLTMETQTSRQNTRLCCKEFSYTTLSFGMVWNLMEYLFFLVNRL
jgi:hypothetical protein